MQTLIKKILGRLRLLPKVNLVTSKTVNGKQVKIPVIKGIQSGATETWMLEVLQKLEPVFNKGFVDVGVNTGQTLVKAWSVFSNLNYVGFEPNPVCVYYVKELVAANKMKNITVVPAGIAAADGLLRLHYYYDDDTDSTASLVEDFRPDQAVHHFQYVPVFAYETIKELLPQGDGSILKIDVEGGELEVLEGLKPWIAANHPAILVEILPVYKSDNKVRLERQQRIEALAHELGYAIASIGKSSPVSLSPLKEIGVHGDTEQCDYLLYHNQASATINNLFSKTSA